MKKILLIGLLFLSLTPIFLPKNTLAQTSDAPKVEYVLFHLETCPHCKDEIKFINKKILPKYGDFLDFKMYEVSSPKNNQIFGQYASFYNAQAGSVPVAFIDGEVIYGYGNDKTTGQQILNTVENKLRAKGLIADDTKDNTLSGSGDSLVNIPILGQVDVKKFSLPLLTVIIGLLDGFNPCAMWVLIFLITLLLGMQNKKRSWLLGSVFILTSGIVYFIFMAAWLNLIMFIGMIFAVRVIIGLVAIGVGGYNLRDWWQNRNVEGVVCKVSKNNNTKKTFEKIKDIVYRQSLWWALLGIIILGFTVNLVEMACSAGFPAVYTQVLAISGLPAWQKYLYMTGYIIFYMLDDLVVFLIAMFTLQSKTVGGKYAKYANLIGGIIILILGLLLIFKPQWLMFS